MASVTEGGAERRSTEQLLESLIETFRAGCVVLENQSENCEDVLTHTINMAVAQMKQLADQTRTMDADVMIPMEIFHYLDHGENPERFVKDSLEKCFTQNQQTHAKVTALDALRDQLAHDFGAEFPEQYRAFLDQAGPTQCPIKPLTSDNSNTSGPADTLHVPVPIPAAAAPAAPPAAPPPAAAAVPVVPPQMQPQPLTRRTSTGFSSRDDESEDDGDVVSFVGRSQSTTMVDVVADEDTTDSVH